METHSSAEDTQAPEISLCLGSESLNLSEIVCACVSACTRVCARAGEKEGVGNWHASVQKLWLDMCAQGSKAMGREKAWGLMGLVLILSPLLNDKVN